MTLRDLPALHDAGLIETERLPALQQVAARYAIAITSDMAGLIDPSDPGDPIARQFVPHDGELDHDPLERADPIGDGAHTPVEGVVHRYPDRVLLKLNHVCAVYCRFCFRREVVGKPDGGVLSPAALDAAMAYVAADPAIWEVILTGGDPLVLSPRRLAEVMVRLSAIGHVKVVRLHTRVPAVDPAAITPELISALKLCGKAIYVALHANHAREMTPATRAACAALVDAGIPMVSQSVLLAGVNDDPQTLGDLMRAFVETRIKPYYLHHVDLAPGTGAFRTSISQGQAVMRELRGRLSGLCQPVYVLDIPDGHGKVPIGPTYLSSSGRVDDPWGTAHEYPEGQRAR